MKHEFCDHCPGCRPALLDPETGTALPLDHPVMVRVNRAWNTLTTYDERKAFIEVTLHNSRDPRDLQLAEQAVAKLGQDVEEPT